MVVKELSIKNGRLNVVAAGRRARVANFNGKVEITKKTSYVNILGKRCKQEKRMYASFIIGEEMEYLTDDTFTEAAVYEAVGDVEGEQERQRFVFSGLRYIDTDPLTGEVEFEIPDLLLIKKMMCM